MRWPIVTLAVVLVVSVIFELVGVMGALAQETAASVAPTAGPFGLYDNTALVRGLVLDGSTGQRAEPMVIVVNATTGEPLNPHSINKVKYLGDEDGEYWLYLPAPGDYLICFDWPGYRPECYNDKPIAPLNHITNNPQFEIDPSNPPANPGLWWPPGDYAGDTVSVGDQEEIWLDDVVLSRCGAGECSMWASGSFVDDEDSVFESDIDWLAREGIVTGCNPPANSQFCPDDYVTRGQMAAFLVRALNLTDDDGGNSFVDDDGLIFETDIARLAAAGITKGCNPPTNDMFCPDDSVTRGQMAAFLVRALGYTDDGGGNLFIDDDGSIFEGDIDKLATADVTRGCNPPVNDRFCPGSNVTRGQMAAFLHRALGWPR